jgi:hypothetical protein
MRSQATPRFWRLFKDLPADVQRLAVKNYRLWQANPNRASLRYRRLEGRGNLVTVRIGDHYRALGLTERGVSLTLNAVLSAQGNHSATRDLACMKSCARGKEVR